MTVFDNLSKEELLDVIERYNDYIQEANEENRYTEDWCPVCIEEFYNNEYQEIIGNKNKDKIVITVEGGIIQDVLSTNPYFDVAIVDFDCKDADENEYWKKESLENFGKNKPFYDIKTHRGVYDEDLPLNIQD